MITWGSEAILGLEQPASQYKPKPATNHFNMEKAGKGSYPPRRIKSKKSTLVLVAFMFLSINSMDSISSILYMN